MSFKKVTIFSWLISAIIIVVLSSYALHAQVLHVSTSGSDIGNDCSIPGMPCATIQHAVDKAGQGDTILINSGIYTESVYINKNLTLIGASPASTIIQADNTPSTAESRVITIDKLLTETLSVHISNVTIRNGNAVGTFLVNRGGGIYNEGDLTLRNVILKNNYAETYGGGLYDIGSSIIYNVQFIGNVARGSGGGMFGDYWNKTIKNCAFIGNRAEGKGEGVLWGCGGGLFLYNIDSAILKSVNFQNNYASEDGGGAYYRFTSVYSENVSFIGNKAEFDGGGTWFVGGSDWREGRYYMNNSFNSKHASYINNTAERGKGGGLFLELGKITINDILLQENFSGDDVTGGGGIYYDGEAYHINNAHFKLKNSRIINNESIYGGAGVEVWSENKVVIKNNLFKGNNVTYFGGAFYSGYVDTINIVNCRFINNDEAVKSQFDIGQLSLINSLFWKNKRNFLLYGEKSNHINILNCIFIATNDSIRNGGPIYYKNYIPTTIVNSIFWRNDNGNVIYADGNIGPYLKISYSNISLELIDASGEVNPAIGPGVVYYDPQFISDTDFRLSDESPLINMGDPDTDLQYFLMNSDGDPIDLAGNLRIIDDTIDMGVYENQTIGDKLLDNTPIMKEENEVLYISPNPATSYTIILLPRWASNSEFTLQVYNSRGQLVVARQYSHKRHLVRLHIPALTAGKYFIRVRSGKKVARGKLIIAH